MYIYSSRSPYRNDFFMSISCTSKSKVVETNKKKLIEDNLARGEKISPK
jgi:hypothetical protein